MKPKKIYTTLYNNYQDGGFKNVNIISKMIGIQCGWVKGFYLIIKCVIGKYYLLN